MTDREYGEHLGSILSSMPGGIGAWGILEGIRQVRLGPVVVGLLFIAVAAFVNGIIINAAKRKP